MKFSFVILVKSLGMTELGGVIAIQPRKFARSDSIGYIVEEVKMKVIDPETDRLLGPNEEGELCFTLDNMMLGYWKNPQETIKIIDQEGKMLELDQKTR